VTSPPASQQDPSPVAERSPLPKAGAPAPARGQRQKRTVLVNQVALVPVVHGLHIVAVEVAQEHAVVARVVLGPLPWGVQNPRARRYSGVVDRVDGVAVGSAEGQVQFPGLGAGGWTEPEVGDAVGARQADDEGITVRDSAKQLTPCPALLSPAGSSRPRTVPTHGEDPTHVRSDPPEGAVIGMSVYPAASATLVVSGE